MIFVILGIAVLVVSFVIALTSLLREQQTFKEKPKIVEEEKAAVKEDKPSYKKPAEAFPKTKKQQVTYGEDSSLTDDRFPWEEPLKNFSPTQEQNRQDLEKEEEKVNLGQKLEGVFFVKPLVAKRKSQKESVSK